MKKRKPRSDKGKPRKPYKKRQPKTEAPATEQTTTPPTETTTPPEASPEPSQTLEDIYNHEEIFKEFTAYEPPSQEPKAETEATPEPSTKEEFIEDDWLEEEEEAEPQNNDFGSTDYSNERDYTKYAIRTIKKFDFGRALALSIWSGEKLNKYLEFEKLSPNDDIVQDTAEVLKKYDVEMKPEYALLTTVLMGTFMLFIEARADRERLKGS